MYGQITIGSYIEHQDEHGELTCSTCLCEKCLYHQSSRCPFGECWDDRRASIKPYDAVHPGSQRKEWSNWERDQAFWCRGGAFFPTHLCPHYVKYEKEGHIVADCLMAVVSKYQDGYVQCSIVDTVGCEECYRRWEERQEKQAE